MPAHVRRFAGSNRSNFWNLDLTLSVPISISAEAALWPSISKARQGEMRRSTGSRRGTVSRCLAIFYS